MVLTYPEKVPNEAAILNRFFEDGLELLHLRKPDWSKAEVVELVDQIDPTYHYRIVFHQHHELADTYRSLKVHFSGKERRLEDVESYRKMREQGYWLSTSVHQQEEIMGWDAYFNSMFYSPVFDSISKPGHAGKLEQMTPLPETVSQIVALGGIGEAQLVTIAAKGFDAAAILGALWQKPEKAVALFQSMQKTCQQLVHSY